MEPRIERRRIDLALDDGLSPEALALLASCGGEIRESDQAVISKASLGQAADRRIGDRPGEGHRRIERRSLDGRNAKRV